MYTTANVYDPNNEILTLLSTLFLTNLVLVFSRYIPMEIIKIRIYIRRLIFGYLSTLKTCIIINDSLALKGYFMQEIQT